jgi:glucose-6-phosphate 1-dehydrogenase
MVKRGTLNVPVIGVAKGGGGLEQFHARAQASLEQHGGLDPAAFDKLKSLLRYVDGDYGDPATFQALKRALGNAQRPAHYLAIPPSLFGTVVEQLERADCSTHEGRVIVEKPFGHDLASARALNRILLASFDEDRIFRIDHYLGKGPVRNMLFFRFTNSCKNRCGAASTSRACRSPWRSRSASRGGAAFYDQTGTVRDVIQNHLFQVMSNLAMEAPARTDSESMRDEKVKVLKSIPAIRARGCGAWVNSTATATSPASPPIRRPRPSRRCASRDR